MEHNLADKAFVFHGVALLPTSRFVSVTQCNKLLLLFWSLLSDDFYHVHRLSLIKHSTVVVVDTMGILLRDTKVTDMHLPLRTLTPTTVATLVPAMETTSSLVVATSSNSRYFCLKISRF